MLSRQRARKCTTNFADFADRCVVFRAQSPFAFSEHVTHDPDAMANVIERDEPQVKHHYAIVQTEVVTATRGNTFD